ncbi:putative peptidyl-prolyl cis-trans isomerase CYP63, partial [Cocos nucifera]
FGKVVSGMSFLKKIEQAGSDKGKPICTVKIVDCGEASDNKTKTALGTAKEDKLIKVGRALPSDDSSDGERRLGYKRTVKDKRKKRKRRYSSSDSYSSDNSDSDSSDSISDSDYSSSDASSSSDSRHKRRKKTSKKDRYRHGKRKRDLLREKQQRRRNKRSRRRSSESSSDPESESASSGSSDNEQADCQRDAHKTKCSSQGQTKPPLMVLGEEETGGPRKDEKETVKDNASHEEGELLNGHGEFREKDNGLGAKVDRTVNLQSQSDEKSSRFRSKDLKGSSSASLRSGQPIPDKIPHLEGATASSMRENERQIQKSPSRSPEKSPGHKASEATLNRGRNLSRSHSQEGAPKRLRKGRGFTEQYAYVRRYRTPSPERSPVRSHYYRGRNEWASGQDRYSRYRTYTERTRVQRYHRSPRGSSPLRVLPGF